MKNRAENKTQNTKPLQNRNKKTQYAVRSLKKKAEANQKKMAEGTETKTTENMVKLVTSDGEEHLVKREIACMSGTIKNMLDDIGEATADMPIPLPNVTGDTLKKVVEYCKHHHENPDAPPLQQGDGNSNNMDVDTNGNSSSTNASSSTTTPTAARLAPISPWDENFCKVDQAELFSLILAANYLEIKPLLDLTCKTVAAKIKGKTPEEIRKTFNIKNDFTPEEEEQIRKENEW